jgi:hypothetical protein
MLDTAFISFPEPSCRFSKHVFAGMVGNTISGTITPNAFLTDIEVVATPTSNALKVFHSFEKMNRTASSRLYRSDVL